VYRCKWNQRGRDAASALGACECGSELNDKTRNGVYIFHRSRREIGRSAPSARLFPPPLVPPMADRTSHRRHRAGARPLDVAYIPPRSLTAATYSTWLPPPRSGWRRR